MTGHVPDLWPAADGPSHWFKLRHPPQWRCETDGNLLHLTASDGHLTLTLHSLWLNDQQAELSSELLHLERIFPVRRNVHSIPALRIPVPNTAEEGEAILGPETPWWRRLRSKREWLRWRVWAMRKDALCAIAIYLQDGEFDPEADTLVRMILESIEFAEPLALPLPLFAAQVLEQACLLFPDADCALPDSTQLRIGDSSLGLAQLYRRYTVAPDRFEPIVMPALRTLGVVQSWNDANQEPQWDDVRERVLPILSPEHAARSRLADFLSDPWVGGLAVMYVVDEKDTYWYIRRDQAARWGLDLDAIHQHALENLDRYFELHEMKCMLTGDVDQGSQLLLPQRPDAYNTSRLLSPRFHRSLHEVLGTEFLVGLPNRDFFVAVTMDSDDTINRVRSRVAADFAQMEHPLSDRLLLFGPDGVSEFVPDSLDE